MDIVIRPVEPGEYAELGEITAQAYLLDGLLDFGESDAYLGRLRDVAGRAAAAEVLVAVERGTVLGGVAFVPGPGPMADLAEPGEAEIRMLAGRPRGPGTGCRGGPGARLPRPGPGDRGVPANRAVDPAVDALGAPPL